MWIRRHWQFSSLALVAVVAVVIAISWPSSSSKAQDKKDTPPDHSKHVAAADPASSDLKQQIADLRAKVAQLEATMGKLTPGKSMGGMGMGSMGMGGMKGTTSGMGMMDMDMMEMMKMMEMMQMKMKSMMGGMGGKSGMNMGGGMGMMDMDMMMGGMKGKGGMAMGGMMDDDMDMMGMGSMGSSKGMKMKMQAALPGFPGASHIYHIGATDFFLDHPEHITLSTEQQTKLNKAKQKAITDKAAAQRKIDEAEQELWALTGADEPDVTQIEAKVKAIEKVRGEQRLGFIRAVGEAAKILTDEQRKILLGTVQPKTTTDKKDHVHPKTP